MSNNGDQRSPNGAKRDPAGRFLPGTAPGPGNPYVQQLSAWRSAVADTITADDVAEVVGVLLKKALAGEPWAVRELLDRTLGHGCMWTCKVQPGRASRHYRPT